VGALSLPRRAREAAARPQSAADLAAFAEALLAVLEFPEVRAAVAKAVASSRPAPARSPRPANAAEARDMKTRIRERGSRG